jgi:hypothetical protein
MKWISKWQMLYEDSDILSSGARSAFLRNPSAIRSITGVLVCICRDIGDEMPVPVLI